MEPHGAGEHRTRMESQAFGCQTSPLEEQGLLFSEHPSLTGGELRPRPALLPEPGIPEGERGRVLGTKQSGCDLWVQILLHIPCISLFWPWPLAQGDLLFLINMLIKSLLSPCCVQGTAKTYLFLVYPGHKIKDGNHFSCFPTSLACWYVRVLYWWDSSAMLPFPERQCR